MLLESVTVFRELINWTLIIVMAKPMLFTMVSAVPFISPAAFWATKVEKSGESAITAIPQKSKKAINTVSDSIANRNGERRQQAQESSKNINAILFVPKISERYPLSTQANPPIPMIKKDKTGILKLVSGCKSL